MKNKIHTHLVLLLIMLGFCSGLCSQKLYLSKTEAETDLEVFIDIYEHHPGLYLYKTKDEIDAVKQHLVSSLADSVSYDDFYLRLLQSLVYLKDGHTGLSPGPAYSDVKRSATTLPFRYQIIGDDIYVVDTLSGNLGDLIYSQIISVNNIPVDTILNHFYKYTSADNNNEIYRKRYNERVFGQNFDFFFGAGDEYAIKGLSPDGDTIHKIVNGIEDYELKINSNSPKPLDCAFDEENDLAILTVNTFDYRKIVESGLDFHQFTDDFFERVRKNKIQNVTIDLRENYGGSGVLAMSLFAYVSPEDFKWMDYSFTYLDGSENFVKRTPYPNGQYPFLSSHDTVRLDNRLKVTNGLESKASLSSTEIPFGPKMKVKNISKNKFYGNLYILTSGITFSAGSIFVSKCTDREKTTIIGEPTGSAAGVFCGGGYLGISLPESGFKVDLPIMERHIAVSNPNVNPHEPVSPHYLINKSLTDIIQGIDPEMNKVYELIKE